MDIGDWSILDTGISSAEENMRIDSQLLEAQADNGSTKAILHLYDWKSPSATYGYFTEPNKFLCPQGVAEASLQLAKRPTGGGIIFHITDFAFSMVVPASHVGYSVNILENYAFVNRIVIDVIKKFLGHDFTFTLLPQEPLPLDADSRHFCMAKPTKYDVMYCGRKVGGGAQRRTRHAFLHQGTISLAFPDEGLLQKVLRPGTEVLTAMRAHTHALLGGVIGSREIVDARQTLKSLFSELSR